MHLSTPLTLLPPVSAAALVSPSRLPFDVPQKQVDDTFGLRLGFSFGTHVLKHAHNYTAAA